MPLLRSDFPIVVGLEDFQSVKKNEDRAFAIL